MRPHDIPDRVGTKVGVADARGVDVVVTEDRIAADAARIGGPA